MRIILLLGAPGAARNSGSVHHGEIWYSANLHWRYAARRSEIRPELGKQAKDIMDAGKPGDRCNW